MPTVDGADFAFEAVDGGVLLVYFGFTACPDVCPTTMADISRVITDLGDRSERVDLAMVTVDPGRDSEAILSNYVTGFVPGGVALRTEDDSVLRVVADDFGVVYEVNTLEDGTVDVLHSGSLFAVDDSGQLTASWAFGTPATDLMNDIDILLSEA